jgi:hypothetical protein
MTAFNEFEQLDYDLDWFAVDKDGKVGHFTTGGFQFLPPSVAKSKENLEEVSDFVKGLVIIEGNYATCPDLLKHLDIKTVVSFEKYIKLFSEMSSKGLYSYDSYSFDYQQRPYFRVTIPQTELLLDDLPQNIKNILEELRMPEISFAEKSFISEEIVSKL